MANRHRLYSKRSLNSYGRADSGAMVQKLRALSQVPKTVGVQHHRSDSRHRNIDWREEGIHQPLTVLDQIEKRLVMLEKELGFTPASRTRVRVQVPEEEEIDEFSNF